MSRRLAAVASLVLGVVALVSITADMLVDFPRGVLGVVLLAMALACAWQGVVRRGAPRVAGVGAFPPASTAKPCG